MGGLKRKIPTDKKIEKKESKSVAFSKRRKGLYSKTSQLCVLSGAQVAILATPPCSKSNVSFFSFGHSSVDNVVSAFLKDQNPREEDHLGSEFWWEDERLAESEDPNELSEAVDKVSRMLQKLKGLRSNREDAKKKKKEVVEQSQTLNLQSTCCASSSCIHEDPLENFHGLFKNPKEEDQIVAVSDNNNNNKNKDVVIHETDLKLEQTLGFQSSSASLCIQDISPENVEVFVNNSEHKDEIVTSSDNSNINNGLLGNLDGFSQVLNLDDDFIDFEMDSEGFITTNLEMDVASTNGYSCTASGSDSQDGAMVVIPSNSTKENQMVVVSDSNNALPAGNLYGSNQEFDIDQIFDFCDE